jgi:hypothetical protein
MSLPGFPQSPILQQANGQVLVSWGIVAGATGYSVQRSTDGVNFTVIAAPTANSYLDATVTVGTQYFYMVAAVNGATTGLYVPTSPSSVVPAMSGQLSLGQIRLMSQQRADQVNSNFVTTTEWNQFINQSVLELYDLLVTCYEDYFLAPPAYFITINNQQTYSLPDGIINTFTNQNGESYVAPPFYKLMGVDLGLANSQPNGFVSVQKFNFIDRNKFIFPNTASTIYGVYNLQYRVMGNQIYFIPIPSNNQPMRLWYIPRLPELLQDTDILDGVSGWTQYVIVRAAKYALDKKELDTSKLDTELLFMKQRIEETAQNRDAGAPDKISDTRSATGGGLWGGYVGGGYGGSGW